MYCGSHELHTIIITRRLGPPSLKMRGLGSTHLISPRPMPMHYTLNLDTVPNISLIIFFFKQGTLLSSQIVTLQQELEVRVHCN